MSRRVVVVGAVVGVGGLLQDHRGFSAFASGANLGGLDRYLPSDLS